MRDYRDGCIESQADELIAARNSAIVYRLIAVEACGHINKLATEVRRLKAANERLHAERRAAREGA